MLRAIIFDFDGVIVDSEPVHYRAFLRTVGRFGCRFDYPQYVERYVGFDDRDAFRAMLAELGRRPDEAEALLDELVRDKGMAFEEIVRQGIVPFDGTLEFVRRAAKELPVAIASGATTQDVAIILEAIDLTGVFDPIVTADTVSRSKPDPETYRVAVEGVAGRCPEAGLRPGQCLAIEDTPTGIESARSAGLRTLGLTTTTTADALGDAERVVASLGDLTMDRLREWYP